MAFSPTVSTPSSDSNEPKVDYTSWSHDQLLGRVLQLESQVRSQINSYCFPDISAPAKVNKSRSHHPTSPAAANPNDTKPPAPKKKKTPKPFDVRNHPTRRIALKFAYQGRHHHGLEYHRGNLTALSTVEEELWKALLRTRLIDVPGPGHSPDEVRAWRPGEAPVDWSACEFSKCGRTDRGVSAFGQVVALRVRSLGTAAGAAAAVATADEAGQGAAEGAPPELPYAAMLNRVLPPSVRVLAWCAALPDNFDARFSCKEREYRYFFTTPAYLPLPGAAGEANTVSGALDVDAMSEAAGHLVGQHDFRNMCKIDGSKQINEFKRLVSHASIDLVARVSHPSFPSGLEPASAGNVEISIYTFTVRGSAFLWHQVRCMVAILFLVGQRLEAPSVVKDLLDVATCPTRPIYEMADDQPLVLWDCRFSATHGKAKEGEERRWDRGSGDDELEWTYAGADQVAGSWRRVGLMEDLWASWRSAKLDEVLWSQLLDLAAKGSPRADEAAIRERRTGTRVFSGENRPGSKGKYVPVMKRGRMEHFEVVNARWAGRKNASCN